MTSGPMCSTVQMRTRIGTGPSVCSSGDTTQTALLAISKWPLKKGQSSLSMATLRRGENNLQAGPEESVPFFNKLLEGGNAQWQKK